MESVVEAIVNVLIIIALIAAVAFIIILLVDLVLSITNKNGSIFFRGRGDDSKQVEVKREQSYDQNTRPQVLADEENAQPTRKSWDEEEAEREQRALLEGKAGMADENNIQPQKDFANERREAIERRKQEFDDFDDFDSLFEEDKEENQPKVQEQPVQGEAPAEEEFNFDDMINEINQDSVNQYEQAKQEAYVQPEYTETVVAPEETQTVTDETAVMPVEEVQSTETSAEQVVEPEPTTSVAVIDEQPVLEPEIDDGTHIEQAPIEPVVEPKEIVNVYEYFPLEMLEDRLAKLQARLKINERDLKGNRKEYTPLARVKRRLERDQEKLRRREAIIARKKVMLYGVNNYVDIDEEKAKKLSEDLDLLDGLRLSVQHCEEVMEQNKDRFPILAKTNEILVEQNRQIKDDIAEVEVAIAKLKEEN